MSDVQKIIVNIGGESMTLLAVEGEEYVLRLATHVNKRIREVEHTKNGGSLSSYRKMQLVAVNIADDYFKEQEKLNALTGELHELTVRAAKAEKQAERMKEEAERRMAGEINAQNEAVRLRAELKKAPASGGTDEETQKALETAKAELETVKTEAEAVKTELEAVKAEAETAKAHMDAANENAGAELAAVKAELAAARKEIAEYEELMEGLTTTEN